MGRPHPNVLKLRKQRMKRAYLKKFSSEVIKVRQTNSIDHWPEEARGLLQRNGNKILMSPDPYLEALFPGKKQTSEERKVCLQLAEEQRVLQLISDHGDLESADKWITVYDGKITRTRITMVFNARRTLVYFLETCLMPGNAYIRKSLTEYGPGADQRAWLAVTNKTYVWIDRIDLHPEIPPG